MADLIVSWFHGRKYSLQGAEIELASENFCRHVAVKIDEHGRFFYLLPWSDLSGCRPLRRAKPGPPQKVGGTPPVPGCLNAGNKGLNKAR